MGGEKNLKRDESLAGIISPRSVYTVHYVHCELLKENDEREKNE
jgi:hypothetical protein